MQILAKLLEWVVGPGLKTLLMPAMLLGLITGWHQYTKARAEAVEAREAALVARGRQQCVTEFELATANARLAAERKRADDAISSAREAARISEEVQANAQTIQDALDRLTAEDGNPDPARCLSRGVLDLVRGHQGGQDKAATAGKGGGR